MNCPKCNVPLLITETRGIEMNYCPQCSGIWLDRERLGRMPEGLIQSQEHIGYNPYNHQHDDLDLIGNGNDKNVVKDWFG